MVLDTKVGIPLMPLREMVLFPFLTQPLYVGRARSLKCIVQAQKEAGHLIYLVSQKDPKQEEITSGDLYEVGVLARILQYIPLPDGSYKVLVEALERAKWTDVRLENDIYRADIDVLTCADSESPEITSEVQDILELFTKYVNINPKLQTELLQPLGEINEYEKLMYSMASYMSRPLDEKVKLLHVQSAKALNSTLMDMLQSEMVILEAEQKIRSAVRAQMDKNQREYYLNEQIKAIQKELGEDANEWDVFLEKIENSKMSQEAKEKCKAEIKKVKSMPSSMPDVSISRNYIEQLLNLPWKEKTRLNKSLAKAKDILDKDHYGLDKVKERILEYLAVQQRVNKVKSPILCLVGPPGVGKTSLGQSIARATNRKYARMALGGVRDEAEIRGHRRTYVGALPGKIIYNLTKTKVKNPLFLLDEIDKLTSDFRGDPASALLEVLDPEQNHTFQDNYLEVDFDLSDVMFIATSNSYNIPQALLDRMEVIYLSGYTEDEKKHIALTHLIPKQLVQNGLKVDEIKITEEAVIEIIRYYTREAGVRGLERAISKVCRKVVTQILWSSDKKKKTKNTRSTKSTKTRQIQVKAKDIEQYLGVRKYHYGMADNQNQIGKVSGLAWTEVGGDLLDIEAVVVHGKGQIQLTGSLGDVMKESMHAARTVVRARAMSLGLDDEVFEKKDIHIHAPEGATPKDGPSAGIAITTALVSALTGIPVRADVAMTGEITLHGQVLQIGGLKEKLLAAHRGGIKTVLIPKDNLKDLVDIPKNIRDGLDIQAVQWIDEVLPVALECMPEPKVAKLSQLVAQTKKRTKTTGAKTLN